MAVNKSKETYMVGHLYKLTSITGAIPVWPMEGLERGKVLHIAYDDIFFVLENFSMNGKRYVKVLFGERIGYVNQRVLIALGCELVK